MQIYKKIVKFETDSSLTLRMTKTCLVILGYPACDVGRFEVVG